MCFVDRQRGGKSLEAERRNGSGGGVWTRLGWFEGEIESRDVHQYAVDIDRCDVHRAIDHCQRTVEKNYRYVYARGCEQQHRAGSSEWV